MKTALRGACAALIRSRERLGLGLGSGQVDEIDHLALDFLRHGGTVSQIDESWDLDRLEQFLRSAHDAAPLLVGEHNPHRDRHQQQ